MAGLVGRMEANQQVCVCVCVLDSIELPDGAAWQSCAIKVSRQSRLYFS